MRRLALLALLLAPSIPRPTGACEPADRNGGVHTLDPQHATDATPPAAPTARFDVYYYDEDDGPGCGTSCGGFGTHISLYVGALDDRTPGDQMGYQLTVVGGQPPIGIDLPTRPLKTFGGELSLYFNGDDHSFTFDLEVRAIDLNGNIGPATVITITNPA